MRETSGPVYSSCIVNRVAPPSTGASVNVRTPLKSPSGIPPDQTSFRPGANSLTRTGKARRGLTFENTEIFSSGAIRPSTRSIPESHSGYRGPSVRMAQIESGLASIVDELSYPFIGGSS